MSKYKVYRIYSPDDEYSTCKLLFKGNYEDSKKYVKGYVLDLNYTYIYYDKIYIVKNKKELKYTVDEYIDVKTYKSELIRQKNTYIEKCKFYLQNIINFLIKHLVFNQF